MKQLSPDAEQWETLTTRFRLVSADQRDHRNSLPTLSMLNPQTCETLLDKLTPVIHSPSRRITASLLSKRIAFLYTAASLYAMSMYDLGLDMSPENSFIEYGYDNRLWQSSMPLTNLTASVPEPNQRHAWRQHVIRQLFAGNLAPLWQILTEVARVPSKILWENTAVRVYSLYERRMLAQGSNEQESKAEEDFHYLIYEAPAELFGTTENPLQQFFWPKQCAFPSGSPVRFRKTCCYYYRASDPKEFCSTCPLTRPKQPRKPIQKEIMNV
ncbi:IucA/IucC family C-terminal-domain containing protein [Hahella ganghwensis]|uniref:IucA/IucC family C-terminal-domain containing protein n=1 Tax=Hahella ganghwensis TaxID=286420 RepID=UPI0003624413|nr:IucA/IucC family C-terminal-domain containing protein [Hahella ganghwensis]